MKKNHRYQLEKIIERLCEIGKSGALSKYEIDKLQGAVFCIELAMLADFHRDDAVCFDLIIPMIGQTRVGKSSVQ